MYSRLIQPPERRSFFLFGPRGTGKTTWVRTAFPKALRLDLLESRLYNDLLADPQRLDSLIPREWSEPVVLDEIQKVPALLDEVHRLIEERRLRFILTGSSPRKLRRGGANLLAGRALTCSMHPLTASEMGTDFDLRRALRFGLLPAAQAEPDPGAYLESYVRTYLEEEVHQGGITRNLGAFARFLESAAFSQGAVLNISSVARDCAVERKVVEAWFGVLEDLLLARRIPVFARRSKRRLAAHPKFYYFDVGVFRTLRPAGPLDSPEEAEGPALETLLLQNAMAVNDALRLGYSAHYWRTADGQEVDLVLYGERGLLAFEIKRRARVDAADAGGLRRFLSDYPRSRAILAYGGERKLNLGSIEAWPVRDLLSYIPALLTSP